MKINISKTAEVLAAVVALTYIVDASFLGGGFQSSMQGPLWLIVAYLAGISQKLD